MIKKEKVEKKEDGQRVKKKNKGAGEETEKKGEFFFEVEGAKRIFFFFKGKRGSCLREGSKKFFVWLFWPPENPLLFLGISLGCFILLKFIHGYCTYLFWFLINEKYFFVDGYNSSLYKMKFVQC